MTAPIAEHTHTWRKGWALSGFACSCGQDAFDWHVDEVKRLKVEVERLRDEIVWMRQRAERAEAKIEYLEIRIAEAWQSTLATIRGEP